MKTLLALLLFVVCSLDGTASAQDVGNWSIDTKSTEYLYAATVNDSGGLLGEFCFLKDNSCAWLLGMATACNQGASYPVLANSDAGAIQLQVYCDGQLENGLFRYVFTEFAAIDDLVKKSSKIGFAVPLQSDQFRVVRFLTKGAVPALTIMRGAAERKSGSDATSDQEL
ncbi:hypothetical protein GMLC_17750 [Geomonas limicola]|uniref:Uncharacterized protein n=2 Tax=Geomonas limicola TaxID=2740186 RepID=A0A6V8N6J9_9BACT|nr:hypothetical protein GMLC_17750 [Geomonas limicola]